MFKYVLHHLPYLGFAVRRKKKLSGEIGVLGPGVARVVVEVTGPEIGSARRRTTARTRASWRASTVTSGTSSMRRCATRCLVQVSDLF